jgi:hypothetical protein
MDRGTSGARARDGQFANPNPNLARSAFRVGNWQTPARCWCAVPAQRKGSSLDVARMLPVGPGGLQSGFSFRILRSQICTACTKDEGAFAKKKIGPADSPVLGPLVRRAEGLPSTRNWPFRWPLSPTSPPQQPAAPAGGTRGNVSRQGNAVDKPINGHNGP